MKKALIKAIIKLILKGIGIILFFGGWFGLFAYGIMHATTLN